jgi:hypothetical protein
MTDVLVVYKDGDGLSRAYASGDEADLEEIREVAKQQLGKYLKGNSSAACFWNEATDYTEEIVYYQERPPGL